MGAIDTGAGNDAITGNGGGDENTNIGIYSEGTINTGAGNDAITGSVGGDGDGIFNIGIFNNGTINTGAGNDTVDALQGGFGGNGTINLGAGKDTLKGFGTGTFNGGDGTDRILFGEGVYEITGSTITSSTITGIMNVTGFENIGGASGGLFSFTDGTLAVDNSGNATFVVC